ncbi:vomeronasal type-2 receptor 26 [Xenopus laevis]|uniref:Vomeronasal type-2 receptor 26 n=1 Tax=Xenopus laevis TaxID=8355 RepID=A0A8J0U6P1_XENLA|nr:vomeronasal type-2 receptor 26 [Xenopus laevis]
MLGAIALSLFLLKLKYLVGLIVIICKFPIVFVDPACRLSIIEAYEEYEYIHEGDVTIGGILTVNSFIIPFTESDEGPDSLMCVSAMLQFYRQLVDFIFAIEKINNDPILLANVTLGYHIYDSCGDPRKAVRSVFQILSGTREPVPNYSCVGKRNIAGFIGDLTSDTTVPIAQILSLFGYAQISYGATGSLLSNRVAFPYFFRTVESDNSHYFALSKLLKYFGWTWVGIIIFSENNEDLKLLSHHLSNNGICVEFHIKIHNYNTDVNYEPYKEIIQNSLTSVIVFCGTASMHMIGGLSLLSDAFSTKTIIVSFTVAANSQILDYAPKLFMGCLGLLQYFSYSLDSPERRLFLETIYPLKYPKDKLLENIWIRYYSCLSEDQDKNTLFAKIYKHKLQNCTGWERISHLHQFDNKFYSPRVLLSVNTMSRALHDIHVSHSKQALTSKIVYKFQLHYYLRNILYDIHEDKTSVFVENGEPISQYLIYNCLLDMDGRIAVTNVGLFIPWAPSDQKMHKGSIRWKTNNSQIPRSQCSDSCLPGYRKAPRGRTKACCYDCVPCSEGEISNITDSENCIRCPDMEWPTNKKRWCTAKRIEFLSYSEDVISVLYLMFSAILFLITVLVLGIFIKYQDSPIVRANNRSLSFLLLVSIKLSFLSVFLFLGRPVDITCMLRNITFGITFSIAVSSLLAKTIMVYVAFKATKPGSSWRKWVGVKLSNSVVLFCSSIQIIICMTWLAISPPFQELDLHTYPGTIIIQCNEGSAIGFYSVIGYMGLLAAVSFVLAFLARTLPDSFNEAKYITFSMLLFCSVWITMIPAYLSTKGKNTVCVEIFAILTSSAGLLFCIFLPKCFIILFRPERNIKLTMLGRKTIISM